MGSSDGHRVYLGNLPVDISKSEIESLFKNYNPVEVTLKERFGFIEFEKRIDAEDAIHDFNGKKVSGSRIVVERALGHRRRENRSREERSNRVVIKNLPPKTTWQEVKDLMRKAGRVTFADVLKDCDGEGVVEFARRDDMKYALKELNGTKLNGYRLKLEEASSRRRRSSRSHYYSRSRSPRRSRSRTRSRSESRSRSPRRSRSFDRSRSSRRDDSASRSRSPERRKSRSPEDSKAYNGEETEMNPTPVLDDQEESPAMDQIE
ncbi:hypothetical protein RMATCC62417_04162 [Rhizopus microsporus]|nr:hypothetical protein RMATCC62417_04162 [Rhizopus microsporus]CEJ02972.1 hypothetical protein RMCBS344292_16964 [Rhizopus microsporus]